MGHMCCDEEWKYSFGGTVGGISVVNVHDLSLDVRFDSLLLLQCESDTTNPHPE
jgi:hypothetical protein